MPRAISSRLKNLRLAKFRSSLAVESLEERRVLAGNVSAAASGGNLSLTGDGEANQILVQRNPDLSVTITSLDGTTTINGQAGPIVLANARDDLSVNMGGGDDVVRFSGATDALFRMYGGMNMDLGTGDDEAGFSNFSVWKDVTINTGSGRDRIVGSRDLTGQSSAAGWGLRVGKNTVINTGDGQDDVALRNGDYLGAFVLNTGADNDTVTIRDNRFRSNLVLNGGADFDRLYSTGSSFEGTVAVVGFEVQSNVLGPTANSDVASVGKGSAITVDVAANDDGGSSTLNLASIVVTQNPTNGSVTVNNNGTVTYTHNNSSTTSDIFRYTIKDAAGVTSNEATVNITVTTGTTPPVNQAPVAVNDAATLNEGGNTTVNVTTNDTDVGGSLNLASIVVTQNPGNGTVTVNANGTVTYSHNGSETTSDTFRYTIKDNQGATSNEATVTLSVTPVADGPVATNDAATVNQSGNATINVAANDTDAGGQLNLTSIVITQQPASGTVAVNNNGTVTYTHNGAATTSDAFRYTIKDTEGNTSNEATVNLTVTPTNQSPVAAADAATVNEGGTQTINVAANDTDANSQLGLTSIVITQNPTFGTATVNTDGTVTYVHNGSETTSDTFRYTIEDAEGNVSNAAIVTITVTPVSDTAVANPDAATVEEGDSVTINVANNDTDAEGQMDLTSIVITQQPANGTVTVNSNGTVVYQHDGSETTSDNFRYTIEDADGNTSNAAVVTITVTPVAEPPTATDDVATVNEGGTQPINVAANDVDPEGQMDLTSIVVTQQPTNGSLTVNDDGTVTYVHNGSETTTDSFRYTIEDAEGGVSNVATVNLTITPVSDTPLANADATTVAAGESVTINAASNDTDAEGDLDLTSIVVTQDPTNGTVTVNPNGTIVYTHDGTATTSDTFRYTIKDSQGNTSTEATVSIAVTPDTPVGAPPVAVDDAATIDEGDTQNIDLAANDTDAENQLDLTSIAIVQQPTNGSLTVNTDGTVSYTHDGSETTTDSFTYTIEDADGNISNVATATVTVNALDDAPVATPDAASVAEGDSVTIDLATNDTDSENQLDLTSIVITQQPANGSVTVNGDGTVLYTHDGGETTSDTFSYTIEDAAGNVSNAAAVLVTVTPVDEEPVAVDDAASVDAGESVIVPVLTNDTDSEGALDPTSVTISGQPVNGTAVANVDGTITYTHDGSATTSDAFTYTVEDAAGNVSNPAVVTITVNSQPAAVDDQATLDEGATQIIDVTDNDTDSEGPVDPASIVIVQQPTNGTATANSDGTVTYVHDGGETTTDSFTYTVADGDGSVSDAATVSITVTPVNDPPLAVDDANEVTEGSGTPATGNVLTNDTDGGDGGATSVSAVDGSGGSVGTSVPGSYGMFNIAADGSYSYTLDDSNPALASLDDLDELIDSISYSVSDGSDEDTALLEITIRGVTD